MDTDVERCGAFMGIDGSCGRVAGHDGDHQSNRAVKIALVESLMKNALDTYGDAIGDHDATYNELQQINEMFDRGWVASAPQIVASQGGLCRAPLGSGVVCEREEGHDGLHTSERVELGYRQILERAAAAEPVMRTFPTGATRNADTDALDYEGFLSPLVLQEFAAYMHGHRLQADGTVRDSDNWQKGIPQDSYMQSGWRHFMDWWLNHRRSARARDGVKVALCALLFNVQGYLHTILVEEANRGA